MRRIAVLVATAVALAVAIGGTAFAAFPQDNVKLYTGCLNSGGNITYVAEGDNPAQPCASPKQVVKLSGGDITSLTVQAPLKQIAPSTGLNGAVTIGLDAAATLPTCTNTNDVPKWNASTSRWTCGTDNDTKYSAGTGLDLSSGNEFSINPDYRVKNTTDCPSGEFANGFKDDNTIQCAAPPGTTLGLGTGRQADFDNGVGVPDDSAFHDYVSLDIPAGTYLVMAKGVVKSEENVTIFKEAGCRIQVGATDGDHDHVFLGSTQLNDATQTPFALTDVVNIRNSPVELACEADAGADGIGLQYGYLIAIKIR